MLSRLLICYIIQLGKSSSLIHYKIIRRCFFESHAMDGSNAFEVGAHSRCALSFGMCAQAMYHLLHTQLCFELLWLMTFCICAADNIYNS